MHPTGPLLPEPRWPEGRPTGMLRITGTARSARTLTALACVGAVGLPGCALATEAATGQAHLTIETRDIDPTGESDLQEVFDDQVVEGQVITVEISGGDVGLTITSVHPDGVEITMDDPLAVTDGAGVHSEDLLEEVGLTTAEPSVHLWTPTLDSGSDIVVTLR